MITAKLKPRLVITLIINDSVGNIELPEFAEDNYCYLSLKKDGTLTLHEYHPFVSGNGEWSNQCGAKYEIVGQYDGDVGEIWEKLICIEPNISTYSFNV